MKKFTSVFVAILLLISAVATVPCAVSAEDDNNSSAINILLCAPKHLVFEVTQTSDESEIAEARATVNGKDYACTPYDDSLLEEDEDEDNADATEEEDAEILEDGEILDDDSPDDYDERSFFDECEGELYEAYYSAKLGDTVTIYVKTTDGAELTKTRKITLGDGNIYIKICDVNRVRFAFTSDTSTVKKSYVKVNGKTINATVFDDEYTDEDDEDSDYEEDDEDDFFDEEDDWDCNEYKVCQARYSAKVGDKVEITVITNDGYAYTKTVKAGQSVPILKINTVYVGDTKVTGTTQAKSTVSIKIGKKTYKTKSNAKGKFSGKIKACKKNKKIKVTVTTSQKCKATKTIKVKMLYGKVKTKKFIDKKTKSVKVKLTNTRKGDIVKLKIGQNIYTKKLTSDKKTKKISFKIKRVFVKTRVKVIYLNQFKKKKGSF